MGNKIYYWEVTRNVYEQYIFHVYYKSFLGLVECHTSTHYEIEGVNAEVFKFFRYFEQKQADKEHRKPVSMIFRPVSYAM